jgi:hypothetical protein
VWKKEHAAVRHQRRGKGNDVGEGSALAAAVAGAGITVKEAVK